LVKYLGCRERNISEITLKIRYILKEDQNHYGRNKIPHCTGNKWYHRANRKEGHKTLLYGNLRTVKMSKVNDDYKENMPNVCEFL
jgi:hypothetical protein